MSHSSRRTFRSTAVAVVGGVLAATAFVAPTAQAHDRDRDDDDRGRRLVDLQVLSFNDFHGNLEAPSGSSGRILTTAGSVDAGGVEYLATHLKQARKGQRNTVTVAAGDLVGASPLLSAAFYDEPTVRSLNRLGLDAAAVGNHEFDRGYKELQRLQRGGCLKDGAGANNRNSCPDGSFPGAQFQYLAANVVETRTGKTILPAYTIRRFQGGARVAFIGMTLKQTPTIVTSSGVRGLRFLDEVQAANRLVPVLRKQGGNAIVVLIHQGGVPPASTPFDYTCQGGGRLSADSAILPIARRLDPAIDMIVSGHTHQPYVCNIPDPNGKSRLVTSASSFGRLFTETTLKYDRRTDDIVRSSVKGSNLVVTRDVPKDPAQTRLIARYSELVKAIAGKVLGRVTTDVTRAGNPAGESALGDLIADAMLADPSVVQAGRKPDLALMNPGGIRADLTYASSPKGEGNGVVTYEEAFTVQPFNNYLVSMDLTGAQIKSLLTEQWSGGNAGTATKILQVSKGFAYTYSGTTLGQVTLNGAPLVDTQTYRVVTNSFLADGGDGFATFASGTGKYFGGLDIDALASHLGAVSPYTPGPLTRITKQ